MSCLFNSLSHFIPENSYNIRQKICDYLEENNPIIEGLETKFILDLENPNYIRDMRNTSTWGGAIEIKAFCDMYEIDVEVYIVSTCKKVLFKSNKKHRNGLLKIYWTGNHYEPVT